MDREKGIQINDWSYITFLSLLSQQETLNFKTLSSNFPITLFLQTLFVKCG